MAKNIKEIGKELMGKSLNSFHRKTGLTQLEENNKMQDGILNGILSQVDDAYIEKTEQSNVIHLDGSGDGVVVVDSIEGNTMVNIVSSEIRSIKTTNTFGWVQDRFYTPNGMIKPNTKYTVVCEVLKNTSTTNFSVGGGNNTHNQLKNDGYKPFQPKETGVKVSVLTSYDTFNNSATIIMPQFGTGSASPGTYEIGETIEYRLMILEGDYSDKELNFFDRLLSSFEEKVNDEGKYEIEILMKNKNLYTYGDLKNWNYNNGTNEAILECVRVQPNTTYTLSKKGEGLLHAIEYSTPKHNYIGNTQYNHNSVYVDRDGMEYKVNNATGYVTFTTGKNINYLWITGSNGATGEEVVNQTEIQLEKGNSKTNYIPHKSNKIKLLINEPLRAFGDIKDKLCIKDKKLVVKRELSQILINGSENTKGTSCGVYEETFRYGFKLPNVKIIEDRQGIHCTSDSIPSNYWNCENLNIEWVGTHPMYKEGRVTLFKTKADTLEKAKTYLSKNPIKLVYQLEEPYYEEVLNEHGEPIILEGYENGTIYIDSTIVPTTTVRYTPKMESFKVLKEVNNNNIMLTNDIDDNIIPYMMDVDLMIMEKEMALMSQYKIRRIGVKDMTSMQKRTQDMLERLIKGKTLTEQECKTRVVTYLNAGKITDAQAEELMLLISEVYA